MIIMNVEQDLSGKYRAKLSLGSECIFLKFSQNPTVTDITKAHAAYEARQLVKAQSDANGLLLRNNTSSYISNFPEINKILSDFLVGKSLSTNTQNKVGDGKLVDAVATFVKEGK